MPDISLCRNDTCPLKEQCYRFMATKDKHQWYADFKFEDGNCEYFMPFLIDKTDDVSIYND